MRVNWAASFRGFMPRGKGLGPLCKGQDPLPYMENEKTTEEQEYGYISRALKRMKRALGQKEHNQDGKG